MPKLNLNEAAAELLKKSISNAGSEKGGSIKDPKANDTGEAVTKNTDSEKNYDKNVSANSDEQTRDADKGDKNAEKLDKSDKPPKNSKKSIDVDNDGIKVEEKESDKDELEMDGEDFKAGKGKEKDDEKSEKSDKDEKDMKESRESMSEYLDNQIEMDVSEDIKAMFKGSDLSEEFISKATTIFEAAVTRKVKEVSKKLAEAADNLIDKEVERIDEELTAETEDFLNLVVTEWLQENQVAVNNNLKAELTEEFIEGMKNLFVEHYIDVPEEKADVLAELARKNEELEESLNEEVSEKMENHKYIQKLERKVAFNELMEDSDLTLSQREKIKELSEDVKFVSSEDYKDRVNTLIESYFGDGEPSDSSKEKLINEEKDVDQGNTKETNANVQAMAKALKKFR